jgi:hypothetical protein
MEFGKIGLRRWNIIDGKTLYMVCECFQTGGEVVK